MWSPVISSSNILDNSGPKKRCKHAVCHHMENMYMYGGKQGHRGLKELWKYNLITKIWEKIESDGEIPPALQQHTMVTNGEKIYVFGGELCVSSESPLWIYDISQQYWYKCYSKTQCDSRNYGGFKNLIDKNNQRNNAERPSGRRGHSAVIINSTCSTENLDNEGSKMIIFGGFKEPLGSTEDLYFFDITEETWHLLNSKEKVPPARHDHSAVVYNGYMWIYGGMTDLKERNDFWKYNIATNQWEPINSWQGPGYLHSHTAVVLNDYMILFGGESQGTLSNDIWKFSFRNGLWEKISCDIKPSPCSQLAAIAVTSHQTVEKAVSNSTFEKDFELTNSRHRHSGKSFGSRHGNEFENDSVIDYDQNNLILGKPSDNIQILETLNKALPSSDLNFSFKHFETSNTSYMQDDERILINEMENSPIDDFLGDTIDEEIEFTNSDHSCETQKGKISTFNKYLQDITLQKHVKNDFVSLINDYNDDNEYLYNWNGSRTNSYNEKINSGFHCDENTFEMQDFSIDNISNDSSKEEIQIVDLDTKFASKTITINNTEIKNKNNNHQYGHGNNKCSLRDVMYIFCGKEESQSSHITESLTVWEFNLH